MSQNFSFRLTIHIHKFVGKMFPKSYLDFVGKSFVVYHRFKCATLITVFVFWNDIHFVFLLFTWNSHALYVSLDDIFTIYLIRMELFGLMEFIYFVFHIDEFFVSFHSFFWFVSQKFRCFFSLSSLMSSKMIQWSFIWKMVYEVKKVSHNTSWNTMNQKARRFALLLLLLLCKKKVLAN